MVQDPETTQFDGMPRSAIATGVVDHVLPIEDDARGADRATCSTGTSTGTSRRQRDVDEAKDPLQTIIALLRARVKYDFSCYKKGTLTRRVQRRMGLRHVESMTDYVQYLRENGEEVVALYKDLLIGVTNFFREPEAWRVLEEQVIAPLVAAHGSRHTDPRVGPRLCHRRGTILDRHVADRANAGGREKLDIQIFASDIDQDALTFARAGIYPENIAADVSAERLKHFFIKGEHTLPNQQRQSASRWSSPSRT